MHPLHGEFRCYGFRKGETKKPPQGVNLLWRLPIGTFFMAFGFFVLLPWRLPGLGGVQYPPEVIEAGKGLLFFHAALFDNPYNPVGNTFTTTADAKNVGFQKRPASPRRPC